MSKKKLAVLVCLLGIILNVLILSRTDAPRPDTVFLEATIRAENKGTYQVYYGPDQEYKEERTVLVNYEEPGVEQKISFPIPSDTAFIRLDFDSASANIELSNIVLRYKKVSLQIKSDKLLNGIHSMISEMNKSPDNSLKIVTAGPDPYCTFNIQDLNIQDVVNKSMATTNLIKKVVIIVVLDALLLGLILFWDKMKILPIELYRNRALILKLAKNDFKTKYAGSYLGIVWAFIQPIVTVLVYWFVFQVGLRSGDVGNFPFVLWLVAGLVPWFFFQDSLNSGTNAMIEYNYLVKKVVFKISVLPIIKIISALFVHGFFILFAVVLYACYGYFPDLYSLQVIYYTLCVFALSLGICYATCAIVIFFRDLTQIINIVLQVGVWMTPIMWNIGMAPAVVQKILKINPMFYVVNGYRDALINKVWFWDNFYSTVYFWLLTAALFGFGAIIFKKLKIHFADVL